FLCFFHATATTSIRTLSLHDALPIYPKQILALVTLYESCEIRVRRVMIDLNVRDITLIRLINDGFRRGSEVAREVLETGYIQFRSEEHTSELQSRENLVCRLLLEKKK